MSKTEDDRIEEIMRAEAERERGPAPTAVTLTGDERRTISDAVTNAMAELQRSHRATRVFGDQRRIQSRIDDLSRALGVLDRSGGRA